jgi:hypothetical protein
MIGIRRVENLFWDSTAMQVTSTRTDIATHTQPSPYMYSPTPFSRCKMIGIVAAAALSGCAIADSGVSAPHPA